jgi:alanyl-tRNA synthetase
LQKRQKELEKELKKRKAAPIGNGRALKVQTVNGLSYISEEVEGVDQRELRDLADRQLEKLKTGVVALGGSADGKAFLIVKVSKDLSKKHPAGKLIQEAAKVLGGSGGGRPDMAQAGGPNTSQLGKALDVISKALA